MYTLAKLDITAISPNPSYSWQREYATWTKLTASLAYRDRCANECFHGRGSQILRNGEVIGTLAPFGWIDTPIRHVLLREYLATVADMAEVDDLAPALEATDGDIQLTE